jgi:hypothetical protein
MCCGVAQRTLLKLAVRLCGPLIRVPSKRLRDARETIASAFATPSAWEGYAGRNFETELASFWCLVFRCLIRHEAYQRVSAKASTGCGKKRAVTVDVLVLV